LPGPGSYSASTHEDSLYGTSVSSKRFAEKYKQSNLSSMFMPQSNLSRKKQHLMPGPGEYLIDNNTSTNKLQTHVSAGEAAFKSKS